MEIIESIDEWNLLAKDLAELGYTIWQMQFGVDCPEGFHARFLLAGSPDIEVVTHSEEVRDAILEYRP
jgi:hypothetical protein